MDDETALNINEINRELDALKVLSHLTYYLASGMTPELNIDEISDLLKIQNERTQALKAKISRVISTLGI